MINRVEILLEMEKETPNDPFVHYALALEYVKNEKEKAEMKFKLLLSNFSNYLPTYYQWGKVLEEQGSYEDAVEIYEKGISLGLQQKDMHTVSELRSALNAVQDELY